MYNDWEIDLNSKLLVGYSHLAPHASAANGEHSNCILESLSIQLDKDV